VSAQSEDKRADQASGTAGAGGLRDFMSNEEWDELLAHVSGLVREMEELPDEGVRKRVFELLEGVDAIHRESLTRLVRLFKEGVLEQVITDPPIHTLMELYDLLPPKPGERDSEDPSRKHGFPDIPVKVEPKVSRQEGGEPRPHWVPVLDSRDALAPGDTRVVPADDRDVLLCRVDDSFFAMDPQCAQDGSSLDGARLNRYTLVCPNHEACYYDVRQGTRVGSGVGLGCYAVRVDDNDRVLIGFGFPFKPKVPAF